MNFRWRILPCCHYQLLVRITDFGSFVPPSHGLRLLHSIFSSKSSSSLFDCVVVGGGIVGSATARQLKISRPQWRVALVEKESRLAAHQSSHNSGVIHAGIYYAPGSLKARLCVEGSSSLYDYLAKRPSLRHRKCGKLIVAVTQEELPRLYTLYERALVNGCKDVELVDANRIREIEPLCTAGLEAIWSPHTGIVDFAQVTESYARDFVDEGGELRLGWRLESIVAADSSNGDLKLIGTIERKQNAKGDMAAEQRSKEAIATRFLITCAGLHSDGVASLTKAPDDISVHGKHQTDILRVVPFRGEYLELRKNSKLRLSTNIYPVPDPRLPFLGVHFTPTLDGGLILGPNAMLAGAREGYSAFDFNARHLVDVLTFKGTIRLLRDHWKAGIGELYRSISLRAQLRSLQRYVPSLEASDVARDGRAGVRAMAVNEKGQLVDDFVFDNENGQGLNQLEALRQGRGRVLHVRNAPSPGATSSLAIAEMIVDKALKRFEE